MNLFDLHWTRPVMLTR